MGQSPETLVKPQEMAASEIKQIINDLEGKHEIPTTSALDDVIHRLLIKRPHTATPPSFEDIQTEMDPEELKAVERLKEETEKRG